LKKWWYVPAATALRNSFRLLMKPSETMILVMVVPTLAPIIMGIAPSSVSAPEATIATTRAVVVELLCNMAVITSPMNNPVNGLDVAVKIVSAAFFVMCCNEDVNSSRAKRNNKKAPRTYNTIRRLLQLLRAGSMGVAGVSNLNWLAQIFLTAWRCHGIKDY